MSANTNPHYVEPVLNDILDQIKYDNNTNGISGNDLTLLSAIPYLPMKNPFSSANQEKAIDSAINNKPNATALYAVAVDVKYPSSSSSGSSNNSSGSPNNKINATIYDCVVNTLLRNNKRLDKYEYTSVYSYKPLLNSDETTADVTALTLSNLSEAFFQAGATAFLGLLCDRINTRGGRTTQVQPNTPVDPRVKTADDGATFQDVVELTRYTISLVLEIKMNDTAVKTRLSTLKIPDSAFRTWSSQHKIPAATDEKEDSKIQLKEILAIKTLAKDALNYVLSVLGLISGESIGVNQTTVGVFDHEASNSLITLGLGPWLILSFVTIFQEGDQNFVTQAYARITFYYLVMVALTALSQQKNKYRTQLTTVVTAINDMLIKSFSNIDSTGPIAAILHLSNKNTSTAEDLSTQSQSLKNRVGIASDLQTTLKFETNNVRYAKYTFYAWLVAFIIVFVTSVVLILTDRINVFLPLAYGILLLIFASWILSRVVSWFRHRDYRNE